MTLHSAALAAGGFDEGQPRPSETLMEFIFMLATFRDPQGNKIALFSDNPNEPGREG